MDWARLRRIRNFQSKDFYPALVIRPLCILVMLVVADWRWLTPNLLTTIATILRLATAALIAVDPDRYAVAAAVVLQLGVLFDHLDGTMARYRRTTSHFGSYYDKVSDTVTWFSIMAAAGWAGYLERADPIVFLLAGVSAYSLLVMGYVKWLTAYARERRAWAQASDPAVLAERSPAPPSYDPPERTARDWARWFVRSLLQVWRCEEMDLYLWLGVALVIRRVEWFLWVAAVSQAVGMAMMVVMRGIENRRLDQS